MKYTFLMLCTLLMCAAQAQSIIPLYNGVIPNSKPAPNEEKTEQHDGITITSKISVPTLSIFLPEKKIATGTAVVICPGGGYWVNAMSHEGTDVAKKFNEMGVAAFVLKYRIPNNATMENTAIGPLQDAQQAIKMVREHAKQWNINPDRIGIMGFSAGGHLASTAGTHFSEVVVPNENKTSVRPDFMILVYPVITFMDSIGHNGSCDQLLGKTPTLEKIQRYSNELQVSPQTPPTLLIHASDDDGVKPENSILFYQALLRNNVPAEMHIFQKGGHGFGMINKTTNQRWMDWVKSWFEINGWI